MYVCTVMEFTLSGYNFWFVMLFNICLETPLVIHSNINLVKPSRTLWKRNFHLYHDGFRVCFS